MIVYLDFIFMNFLKRFRVGHDRPVWIEPTVHRKGPVWTSLQEVEFQSKEKYVFKFDHDIQNFWQKQRDFYQSFPLLKIL